MRRNDFFIVGKNSKKQLTFEEYNPVELTPSGSNVVKIDRLPNSSSPTPRTNKTQLDCSSPLNARSNNNHIPLDIISLKTISEAVAAEDFEYIGDLLGRREATKATRDYFAHSLIKSAIEGNKLAVIHYLLEKGVKIPCNYAIDIQALRSQLMLRGDYGSVYRMGETKINDIDSQQVAAPIHLAVISNNVDMVKFLLFCRADVNSLDGFGNSALHLAVSRVNEPMVKLLLKNNANPKLANKENISILTLLDNMVHSAQLHLIKQHIQQSPETPSEDNNSVLAAYEDGRWANDKILSSDLIAATNRNDIKRVNVLLGFITVENITKAFSQAVHIAIENGNLDLVKLFLQKCGNMPSFLQVFNDSETPIAHAIRANKEDIISFLAEQSSNVDNFSYSRDIMAGLGSAEIEDWFS